MGYVQSASTVTLRARLTQKGREELLSGTTMLTVKYFALGDGDANYRSTSLLSAGRVPDVTGDYSGCTLSLADGVGLHHPIGLSGYNPTEIVIPTPTVTTTSLLFACGDPSNITLSGNSLTCDIHVNRLMNAESKILYNWYGISSLVETPSLWNVVSPNMPGGPTSPIQFSGTNNGTAVVLSGEPYANFYDFIYVNKKHESNGVTWYTQEYDDVEIEFATEYDRYLWESVNNILIYKDETEYPYIDNSSYTKDYTNIIRTDEEKTIELKKPVVLGNTLGGTMYGVSESQMKVSPMVVSFSSLDVSDLPSGSSIDSGVYNSSHLLGVGPGGLMVSAREYGYYCDNGDELRGFLPVSLVEGNCKTPFASTIYPSIRIKPHLGVNETVTPTTHPNPYQDNSGQTTTDGVGPFGGFGEGESVAGVPYRGSEAKETVFVYDAHSGYLSSTILKYDFFYDGSGRKTFPGDNDTLYTMDKLRYDPFNATYNNPLGNRGFSNATYTPSKLELTQMSAFDHIVTQGRLLGLATDPYIERESNSPNLGFGCVGNGGLGPDGNVYGNGYVGAEYEKSQSWGSNEDDIVHSKNYIFNTSNDSNKFWVEALDAYPNFYKLSLQNPTLPNYGLTLLAHERAMVDEYFKVTCASLEKKHGFIGKVTSGINKKITINLNVKTKNLKDGTNAPYSASLTLNFKNTSLSDDATTAGTYPSTISFGYVTNISPIIERITA